MVCKVASTSGSPLDRVRHLRHRNGNILADSGQGYSSRTKAFDGIDSVKRNAPNAETTEI